MAPRSMAPATRASAARRRPGPGRTSPAPGRSDRPCGLRRRRVEAQQQASVGSRPPLRDPTLAQVDGARYADLGRGQVRRPRFAGAHRLPARADFAVSAGCYSGVAPGRSPDPLAEPPVVGGAPGLEPGSAVDPSATAAPGSRGNRGSPDSRDSRDSVAPVASLDAAVELGAGCTWSAVAVAAGSDSCGPALSCTASAVMTPATPPPPAIASTIASTIAGTSDRARIWATSSTSTPSLAAPVCCLAWTASVIMTMQNGQAVETMSGSRPSASSVRSTLIILPMRSSIHIRAPPAPQQKPRDLH